MKKRLLYKLAYARECHIRSEIEAQLVAARAEKDALETIVKQYREQLKALSR